MSGASGILTIDLQAVRQNYRILCARVRPGTNVSAVVKANAYGLGAPEVAKALMEEECDTFFVANMEEALILREHCPTPQIFILNGFYESQQDLYFQHNLIPVLGSFMEIAGCRALAEKTGMPIPVALHFNTRMNRLGFAAIEAEEMIAHMDMLEGLDIRYVMSHLACADEPDHPMNQTQLAVFKAIAEHFPGVPKSLANSSGIFLGEDYHFDMVRPGMAIYGLNPTPEHKNPMQPVVTLQVPVIRTRLVYAGAAIGYNATYTFDEDTPLATVSAGYADGLFWSLSNNGQFFWGEYPCPIRGRVSMDLTTVDLSNIPKAQRPKPGDFIEVIGQHQSADELGAAAGTIGYEVLTRLGRRYERHYVG